jgi:hypothetical protein
MDLKEYIKSLIRQQLEEESTTAGVPGYMTPYAFSKSKGKNAATKQAGKEGWKQAKGMPKHSKMLDYKELWPGKKSAMNEIAPGNRFNTAEDYMIDGKEVIYKWIRDNKYIFQTIDGKIIEIGDKDVNKVKKMNESLLDLIEQELLNEVTYHKFKNEVKFRTKNEQLHKAIREVKRKLAEIDRIVEYTSRMKQELSEGEEGLKYWKKTESNVATISEMINQLNNKIKNLQQ